MNDCMEIRSARTADIDAAAAVLSAALHPLPMTQWLIPDPALRHTIMPRVCRSLVDWGIRSWGEVYMAELHGRPAGVAVWLRVAPGIPHLPPGFLAELEAATDSHFDRFRTLHDTLEAAHPSGEATPEHVHLALLGVLPDAQRKRVGTTLLHAGHQWLDREQTPAYAEAGHDAIPLYRAHGYRTLTKRPTTVGGMCRVWPMWRQPQPPTAAVATLRSAAQIASFTGSSRWPAAASR